MSTMNAERIEVATPVDRLLCQLRVNAIPVAQPRQRHRVITAGGRAFASNYTPQRDPVNAYKASIRAALSEAFSGPPLQGPLRVVVEFVFDRPKYLLKPRSYAGRILYTKKPDADNLVKSTFDALNGLLWSDDAQCAIVEASKWWRDLSEAPHVRLSVWQSSEWEVV